MPRLLLTFGCGSLLILATPGLAMADDTSVPVNIPTTGASPTSSPAASVTGPASAGSATPDDSQANGNPQNPDDSQVPLSSQIPYNPLLPQQGGSAYLPFSPSPAATTAQSPAITAPSLFTTGRTDVSQIATNAGLAQAFSNQSNAGFLSSEQEGAYSHPPIERIRLGPFDLKGTLLTGLTYDDNLRTGNFQTQSGKQSDANYDVTPAILLEYGDHEGQRGYASLVYSPTISRFFHYTDQDSVDQNVSFSAQYPFQRLSLNLSQTYAQSTGVNQDLNTRTTQSSSFSSLGGSYDIDDKLSLAVQLTEAITSFSQPGGQGETGEGTNASGAGQGDQTSSINTSLVYHFSEKLTGGPSINVGLDKPQGVPNETFEQGLLGLNYQPTVKIGMFGQAGVEFRQYGQGGSQAGQVGEDNGDEVDPIFSIGVSYVPFDSTSFSLSASQSVHSSAATSGQTVVNTGVGFNATQRLFQRLFGSFDIDYSHNNNQNNPGGSTPTSGTPASMTDSDDTISYRPALSIAPTAWTSVAIFYQYMYNKSNTADETYHDNQLGISFSAQF